MPQLHKVKKTEPQGTAVVVREMGTDVVVVIEEGHKVNETVQEFLVKEVPSVVVPDPVVLVVRSEMVPLWAPDLDKVERVAEDNHVLL